MAVVDKNFKSKVNAIRIVLLLSVVIMMIKFVAYYLTKSNALLSDALESFINIATSSFTLYSIHYSAKLKLILTGFAEVASACHDIFKIVFPDQVFHFEYSTSKGVN
jgi:hypothetical protein